MPLDLIDVHYSIICVCPHISDQKGEVTRGLSVFVVTKVHGEKFSPEKNRKSNHANNT